MAVWSTADDCSRSQDCHGYRAPYQRTVEKSHEIGFWEWTTHDPVAFYTAILSLFTLFLAVASVWQGVYLIRAERTATMAANAAKGAAEIAGKTAEIMDVTAERQLRAYIFIENAWIKQVAGLNAWEVHYRAKNFGQTPASKVVITDVGVGIDASSTSLPVPMERTHFGAVAPNGDFIDFVTRKIEFVSFDDLRSERKSILLVGKITYIDAFEKHRWTKFCFIITGEIPRDGEMDIHDTGNEYY